MRLQEGPEDPTLALQRGLELIEHLDRLGYDEAWIGEHHSARSEIIASPERALIERLEKQSGGFGCLVLRAVRAPQWRRASRAGHDPEARHRGGREAVLTS